MSKTLPLCMYLHLLHSAWHILGAHQMSVEQNYWSFKSKKKAYQRNTQTSERMEDDCFKEDVNGRRSENT